MLIIIGVSGCIQKENHQESNTLNLISYQVWTYEENMTKIGDGFVHTARAYWYLINGTVKQTFGRQIPTIRINLSFFDGNDTYLDDTFTHIYNVQDNQESSFSLRVHLASFNETEKVTFELSEI